MVMEWSSAANGQLEATFVLFASGSQNGGRRSIRLPAEVSTLLLLLLLFSAIIVYYCYGDDDDLLFLLRRPAVKQTGGAAGMISNVQFTARNRVQMKPL